MMYNKKVIDCKWVFKQKYKANGEVKRLKARLVTKRFQQDVSINFTETFSPVAKLAIMRIVFSIATSLNLCVKQIDTNNVFLNGLLQENVFIKQPQGFEDLKFLNYVCKLGKTLYGLKQAPSAWFDRLRTILINQGFSNTN